MPILNLTQFFFVFCAPGWVELLELKRHNKFHCEQWHQHRGMLLLPCGRGTENIYYINLVVQLGLTWLAPSEVILMWLHRKRGNSKGDWLPSDLLPATCWAYRVASLLCRFVNLTVCLWRSSSTLLLEEIFKCFFSSLLSQKDYCRMCSKFQWQLHCLITWLSMPHPVVPNLNASSSPITCPRAETCSYLKETRRRK